MAPSGINQNLFVVARKLNGNKFRTFDSFTSESGALADRQERSINDPSRDYVVIHPLSEFELIEASGVVEDRVFDVAVDILHVLSSKGEETTSNPRSRFGFAVNEYFAGADSETLWNVRQPQGFSASGMTILTGWFTDFTAPSGDMVKFRCSAIPLFPGSAISGQPSFSTIISESGIVANTVRVSTINISGIDPARRFFSLKFERLGTQDSYNDSIFTFAHGISFDTIEKSLVGDPLE